MTGISLNTYIIFNLILFFFNFKQIRNLKSFKINIVRGRNNFKRVMLIGLIISLILFISSLLKEIVNYLKYKQLDMKYVSFCIFWIQICLGNMINAQKNIK